MLKILPINKIILFILIFLFAPLSLATAEWTNAPGEFSYTKDQEISVKQACEFAKQRAELKAIEKVLGEKISVEKHERCSTVDGQHECERNQIYMHSFDGSITKLEIIDEEDGKKDMEGIAHYFCKVKIRANVTPTYVNSDPNFDLTATLNEFNFRHGEKMQIEIIPSQKMFLTIFQWFPYVQNKNVSQVVKLFPNEKEMNNEIKTNKLTLPTKGWDYLVEFPENIKKQRIDEYLIFIASKDNIKWLPKYSGIKHLKRTINNAKNNTIKVINKPYTVMK